MYLYCLDQAEDLFGGGEQVLTGGFGGHGFFQGGYGVEDGEEGVDAVLIAEAGFRGGAAGEGKDGFVVFLGDGGDADGGFSHDGLAIEAAFAGDNDVSIFDVGFQSDFFQDDLDAGLEDGVCVRQKGEAESSGSSGAWVVRVGIRVFFTGDVGIGSKPLIHLADHVRSGSFLRSEDGAAALGSAEWVGHITGNFKVTFFQFRYDMYIFDGLDQGQAYSTEGNRLPVFVKKFISESLKHANAAVVCSASTDSDDKVSAVVGDGITDQFAHAVSRCMEWIAVWFVYQSDSRSGGHFNNGGL